jgi:hypothetical protein
MFDFRQIILIIFKNIILLPLIMFLNIVDVLIIGIFKLKHKHFDYFNDLPKWWYKLDNWISDFIYH